MGAARQHLADDRLANEHPPHHAQVHPQRQHWLGEQAPRVVRPAGSHEPPDDVPRYASSRSPLRPVSATAIASNCRSGKARLRRSPQPTSPAWSPPSSPIPGPPLGSNLRAHRPAVARHARRRPRILRRAEPQGYHADVPVEDWERGLKSQVVARAPHRPSPDDGRTTPCEPLRPADQRRRTRDRPTADERPRIRVAPRERVRRSSIVKVRHAEPL